MLVKVTILGPEYFEDQLAGGPTHQPRRQQGDVSYPDSVHVPPITPSQALRLRHQHLHSISVLANQFGAKIVDVSEHSVIVELTAKTARVEAFLNLLKPFGILEAARTGLMAMPRTPIKTDDDEGPSSEDIGAVDASMLPPG